MNLLICRQDLKKGIFSNETALFLWDLTDRTPNRYDMTFPDNYNLTNAKNEGISCSRVKQEWYKEGVVQTESPGGCKIVAYNMERLLERIFVSEYQQSFILKGGFFIAAMVDLDTHATMDMDATIKGWPVNEDSVKKMLLDICENDSQDDVTFEFKEIGEIREGDDIKPIREHLL